MFGLPAAATNVGNQSMPDTMPFSTLPAGTLPGQRRIIGTRKPPSSAVPLPPANGVWPPSGHVKFSVPLSVVKHDDGVVVEALVLQLLHHRAPMSSSICAIPASSMDQPFVRVAQRLILRREMGDDVHASRVEPDEERLAVGLGLVDELQREVADLVVHGFHPLRTEFAGVLDLLLADLAPARMLPWCRRRWSPTNEPCCADRLSDEASCG